MISKLKYEYLLFFIAIVWLFFFSFVLQLNAGFSYLGDDISYLIAAKNLYLDLKIDALRPLIITAINGFPFLFGFSESIVIKWSIFVNFLCWISTAQLIFRILKERINRRKAFQFSLLFILCIGNLAISFNLLSESIFIFLLILAIYFVNKFLVTANCNYLTLSISILLFTVLVRPISIGLAILLVLIYYKNLNKILTNRFSALILVSLFLIVFQMFSLKKNFGDYTISYIGSITYYNYLGAKADCFKKQIEYVPGENKRSKHLSKLSLHKIHKIANEDLKNQLLYNKYNLFKAYLFCMYSNSTKGSYIVSTCKNSKQTSYFNVFYFLFKTISKAQNIFFTILGIIVSLCFLLRKKITIGFNTLLSIFILYLFFMSAISCFQADRFHIVLYPIIILLLANFYKKDVIHD